MTKVLPHAKGACICFCSALIVSLFSSPGHAESTATAEWNISADKITRLQDPNRIIAEGNIVLEKREEVTPPARRRETVTDWAELLEEDSQAPALTPQDLQEQKTSIQTTAVITADWMSYDVEKEAIEAKGNVSVTSGEDKLTAEDAHIDLSKETGSFTDAVIVRQDHELHLEGKAIEKTGENTYRIEQGWVITCRIEQGETPPWKFSSAETTVEPGGYAVLKHARFHIRDVPVFYMPYMIVPVKNTRQTGLLFPEFSSSSRDGFGINLPLFVNISSSTDMTFYPEYYSERGFMPGAEFRYVLDAQNKGRFMGSYLDDALSDPEEEPGYYADGNFTHTNSERYWFRGKADHDFGNDWIARLDVDIVSDRDYLEEFDSGITGFDASQSSFLETFGRGFENADDDQRRNTFKLLKSWTGSSLNINFLGINDVRAFETSPDPLWKLPEVDYSGALPLGESDFSFNWDANYVNYWREDGVGGNRVDLYPRLSSPVPVGPYLESRAEVGGRGTLYMVETYGDSVWEGDDNPSRALFTFNIDLATTLMREFALAAEDYSSLSHSIRPFVEYEFISDDDQDELPLFDDIDRIDDVNAITYGVDSFFDLYDNEDSFLRQYGYARIEQSYDLRSEADDEPFLPIIMKLGWRPLDMMTLFYKAEIPVEDDQNTTHGFEGYYTNSRGDRFGLDYRYNEDESIEQINASVKAMLLPQIRTDLWVEHSISESETNEAAVGLTYLAQCWSVMLKTEYTPSDERVMLIFNLANIGSPLGLNL